VPWAWGLIEYLRISTASLCASVVKNSGTRFDTFARPFYGTQ
jgi:hypothetical protein